MINIDAMNPDWPRPIHLPDEEETLDKQVSSGAASARERGLVPQSGDWEKPYRWVRPEDADVAVDDTSGIPSLHEVYDLVMNQLTVDIDFEEEIGNLRRGVFARPALEDTLRGNKLAHASMADAKEVLRKDIIVLTDNIVRAFNGGEDGPTPNNAKEGFGAIGEDGERLGQRTIPKWQLDRLKNIFVRWGDSEIHKAEGIDALAHVDLKNGEMVFWKAHNYLDIYKSYGTRPSYNAEYLANTAIHELGHTIFATGAYDAPLVVLVEVSDAWNQALERYGDYQAKSPELFPSEYSRTNISEFFAECFKVYISNTNLLKATNPQMFEVMEMLNKTDSFESLNISFSKDYYTKHDLWKRFSSGDTSKGGGIELYMSHALGNLDRINNPDTSQEQLDKDKIDLEHKLKLLKRDIGYSISVGASREDILAMTLDYNVNERINDIKRNKEWKENPPSWFSEEDKEYWTKLNIPEEFDIAYPEMRSIVMGFIEEGISKHPNYGKKEPWISAYGQRKEKRTQLKKQLFEDVEEYEPEHVIVDTEEIGESITEESVRLANLDGDEEETLDKQAVSTGEPPDLSVASRMKARGLEWKKETHRWIRPEDAEEEEPQIHELSGDRDSYFDALMERFQDKKMSAEDLTEEQKVYLSDIKNSMDVKTDYLSNYVTEQAALPDNRGNWTPVFSNIRSELDNKTYSQFRVSAMDAVVDAGFEVDLDSSVVDSDLEEIMKLVIRPYMLSQFNELADKIQKTVEEIDFTPSKTDEMTINREKILRERAKKDVVDGFLGPVKGVIREMSLVTYPIATSPQDLVDLYIDGVLDINGRYDRKSLNDSLIYSIDNFISRDELDKVLQFSRDNLFKLVSSGDRIGVNNIVSKIYDSSSQKDKSFMREALLNSLKDEELVSHIQMDFFHQNHVLSGSAVSNETKDVLSGINHLTLAIYEDMLKNGDIDDLAKFFSDENIPTGVLSTPEYSALPFHFLSEHVSVDEFDSHVDTFLNSGQILRKAGIEALSFIDPKHPSLLEMAETEENPNIMNHLANNLPVTALEDLSTRTQDMWESIDSETPFQEALDSYAKEHDILGWILTPDNEGYEEYREEKGKQTAYAEKSVALLRHSRRELEQTNMKAKDRLDIFKNVGFDIGSIESFHSMLKKQPSTATTEQAYLPGMEPGDDETMIESGQYQPLFNEWANNLPDEFVGILEKGFSDYYDENPGLPKLFDELYYGTLFGKMHTFSKGAWEGSSSSPWGGILKESVARQLDDKVIFHSERRTRPSIDEVLERERNTTFIPDKINSANFNQENLDTYVRMHKNLTRALLDIVIPDSDTIEVFRGSSSNELSSEDLNTLSSDDFSSANIESNSLSSYSLNESTASEHFAEGKDDGIVINIPELHKDNIWSTFLSHSYQGNEREILVINHSDMDAYAKSTEQAIDTDQFNPDFLDSSSIDDMYGISGYTDNDYIDEFRNVSALEKDILDEITSGNNSYFEDYMNSPHYDSYMVQEWAASAAQQIMDWSEENYDYTINISAEQEEAIEIVENFEFLGRITRPEHVLDNYPLPDGYKSLSQNIFDKQKQLWEEGGSTHVAVVNEGDEEELSNESDRIAIELMEWAKQGQSKVSGI